MADDQPLLTSAAPDPSRSAVEKALELTALPELGAVGNFKPPHHPLSRSSPPIAYHITTPLLAPHSQLTTSPIQHVYTNTRPLWHPPGARGIYGGAVIAQCLSAAQRTVPPGFGVHSMHCYFVLGGDAAVPVVYRVRDVRQGRSFAIRMVEATQRARCIFTTTLSFVRRGSAGARVLEHALPMPLVQPPDDASPDIRLWGGTEGPVQGYDVETHSGEGFVIPDACIVPPSHFRVFVIASLSLAFLFGFPLSSTPHLLFRLSVYSLYRLLHNPNLSFLHRPSSLNITPNSPTDHCHSFDRDR